METRVAVRPFETFAPSGHRIRVCGEANAVRRSWPTKHCGVRTKPLARRTLRVRYSGAQRTWVAIMPRRATHRRPLIKPTRGHIELAPHVQNCEPLFARSRSIARQMHLLGEGSLFKTHSWWAVSAANASGFVQTALSAVTRRGQVFLPSSTRAPVTPDRVISFIGS